MSPKPQMTDGLEIHSAGNEVLVHDSNRRKVHVLNQSAAAVLRACDGTRDIKTLALEITNEPSEAAYKDTARIVETFVELGLVTIEAAEPAI
jgi:hypothetical protein